MPDVYLMKSSAVPQSEDKERGIERGKRNEWIRMSMVIGKRHLGRAVKK